MKTILKDEYGKLYKIWDIPKHNNHCDIPSNHTNTKDPKDEYLALNMKSKDRFIRNIFCELKSEIESTQEAFFIEFESLIPDVNEDVVYVMRIVPNKKSDMEKSEKTVLFDKIRKYISDMLYYLLSEEMDINVKTNDRKLNSSFTVVAY